MIKQFSASGYEHSDVVVIDELEMQRHQQLEKLYRSTRAGKVLLIFLVVILTTSSETVREGMLFAFVENRNTFILKLLIIKH